MPREPQQPFDTKQLPAQPDHLAPDGSAIRELLALAGGSLAHCTLPAGAVSHPVSHRTVEEIWYCLAGAGQLWRREGAAERVTELAPGTCVSIPVGTAFQFRAGAGDLQLLIVTMPPWPGPHEAMPAAGRWEPSLS
jgi:mannose-6-phosphate isomerase-like protein (cupin superfamily)